MTILQPFQEFVMLGIWTDPEPMMTVQDRRDF